MWLAYSLGRKPGFILKTEMSNPVSYLYIHMLETDLKYRLKYHPLLQKFQMTSQKRFGESQDSTQKIMS